MRWSNCWIEGIKIWLRHYTAGAKLIFIATKRHYKWPVKAPHCYVELPSGKEIEFVPNKDTLGNYPSPLFKGHLQERK